MSKFAATILINQNMQQQHYFGTRLQGGTIATPLMLTNIKTEKNIFVNQPVKKQFQRSRIRFNFIVILHTGFERFSGSIEY